ncbi:hypothetical protein M426DRAFT_159428 [Hypoxylon sp. CI-4A]|nr:hypothetical protein M426DRAFT_159428 [Hypoxylon sp. CI-4A]
MPYCQLTRSPPSCRLKSCHLPPQNSTTHDHPRGPARVRKPTFPIVSLESRYQPTFRFLCLNRRGPPRLSASNRGHGRREKMGSPKDLPNVLPHISHRRTRQDGTGGSFEWRTTFLPEVTRNSVALGLACLWISPLGLAIIIKEKKPPKFPTERNPRTSSSSEAAPFRPYVGVDLS